MLEKYGVPIYKENILEHIIYQIMSSNIELNTEVNIYRSSQ